MTDTNRELILRLAAANAALDPERRSWRRDVLLSAVVEVLGSVDAPRPTAWVVTEVRRAWATAAVPEVAVQEAIRIAHAAGLVAEVTSFDHQQAWQLSASAREEVSRDQDWALAVLEDFRRELSIRLSDLVEVDDSRVVKISEHLLTACVIATNGVYEVARSADRLAPVELDLGAMTRYLRDTIQPKSVYEACVRLAEAIADPDDEFGNQILHLLLTGNLLHGLLSRQDLADSPGIEGQRIVLDTSFLVYSLDPDSSEGHLFDLLVDETIRGGGEVVVPEHVLEEWEAVWNEASEQMKNVASDDLPLIAEGHILVRNPVIQAFAARADRVQDLNWYRYSADRRSLHQTLTERGVIIRPHGNGPDDQDLIEAVSTRLQQPGARRYPTAAKADRDAHSCAMVARWRRRDGSEPPRAWFVAQDTATGRAYRRERPDDEYPLTVSPESWLLYISVISPPEDDGLAARADTIGEVVRRLSFLNVASGYTVEDALNMMRILRERSDGDVDPGDLRQSIQLDLNTLLSDSEVEREDPVPVAVRVAQDRLRRREHRAEREAQRVAYDQKRKEAALAQRAKSFTRERSELLRQKALADQRADGAVAAHQRSEVVADRRVHRVVVLFGYVLVGWLLVRMIAGSSWTAPIWIPSLIVALGLLPLWLTLNDYVNSPDTRAAVYIRRAVIGATLEAILILVSTAVASALNS